MGIEDIWKQYKTRVGYGTVISGTLRGTSVAVDSAAVLGHPLRCVAKNNYLTTINPFSGTVDHDAVDRLWLPNVIRRLAEYYSEGFTPIIVFDGPSHVLKQRTIEKRALVQEQASADLDVVRTMQSDTPSSRSEALKCLKKIDNMPRPSKDKLLALVIALGVPYVIAAGEAERTCALMNRDGVVRAAITPDGDFLACGGVLQLKEKCKITHGNIGYDGYVTAEQQPLLSALGVSFEIFQQICIMSGTDMNHNIKGISWGSETCGAEAALKKYGSIAQYSAATGKDITCLNHLTVYEECFKTIPWKDSVTSFDFCPVLQEDEAHRMAADYNATKHLATLMRHRTAGIQ